MPVELVQKTIPIRKWTVGWILFVIGTYLASLIYFVYGFIEGYKGNTKYQYISNLILHPSWANFKIFIATIANDPVTDFFLLLMFVLLPIPALPFYGYQRIELLLAKVGLYQLFITAVLGSPNYNPQKTNENMATYVIGWVLFGTIISLFFYSFIYSKLPKKTKECLFCL